MLPLGSPLLTDPALALALQVLVVLSPLQETVFREAFDVHAVGRFWNHVMLTLEMPLVAWVLRGAFPASELPSLAGAPVGDSAREIV